MTCQRRGIGLACIVLCAALPSFGPARAASVLAEKGAASSGPAAPPAPASAPSLPPLPLDADEVLAHIKRTLDWYRESQSLVEEPLLATDVVERDQVRGTALTGLRLAFDFGRAAGARLAASAAANTPGKRPAGGAATSGVPAAGGAPSSGSSVSTGTAGTTSGQPPRSLDRASERIASRMMQLQSQIAALDARLAHASARSRAALRAQRSQLAAALALEREVQTTVGELQRFQSSTLAMQGTGSRDLLGQIAELERTVPEVRPSGSGARGALVAGGASNGSQGSSRAGAPTGGEGPGVSSMAASSGAQPGGAGAASAVAFHPESAGIIALISQWISLEEAQSKLEDMLKSTDGLDKGLDALRAPLVAQARVLARADTTGVDSTDPAELDASRRTLEAAAARFRQLAALLVPLGDQNFVLDSARATLSQWRGALRARIRTVAGSLLARLAILGALILAVLVVSEVWRRAVFKYLQDARRRSQFQTLRRVVVGALLAVVILLALVSQLGSLATYVGFLTAGLAVALQTVILSIVAYFFFIGRYGVRVGDRITLSGVTGRVVDIGLIRIYLMELAGPDLHSTGRIVVLSNSVLFQPQALFKQIPGADYLWHTISLTLAPTVDVQAAQQRLKATADEVFEHYRSSIEAQHAAVRRLVDFDASAPCPEVRLRFAEHGWSFDVRYPVHADQAARIDQRMLKAIREAIADAEHFPLADAGGPALSQQA